MARASRLVAPLRGRRKPEAYVTGVTGCSAMSVAFSASELGGWTGGEWRPAPDREIRGVSHDTREIGVGSLFVALRGDRFDGHDFVAEAFGRGACAALVERGRASRVRDAAGALLWVDDSARALREMAAGHRGRLAASIIAVTGSAGKSTVKELIAQLLSARGPTASTRGNWNNAIGLPLSLLQMGTDARFGVFEAGTNHPGEIAELCRILKPGWGVVTVIGGSHLEFFGSEEGVAREKSQLLAALPPDGAAVLNRDTAFFDLLRSAAPARVITVSLTRSADYRCVRRDPASGETEFLEGVSGERFAFRLRLPGAHQAANALLAVAVARAHGLEWEDIRAGLERFEALPMRWEELRVRGVGVIDDAYNANPASMRAALEAFAETAGRGAKWLVLGGMLELGARAAEEHLALGAFVAQNPWSGLMVVGELGERIAEGARQAGFPAERVVRCRDARDAAAQLRERMAEGDNVLVKASRGIGLDKVATAFRDMNIER